MPPNHKRSLLRKFLTVSSYNHLYTVGVKFRSVSFRLPFTIVPFRFRSAVNSAWHTLCKRGRDEIGNGFLIFTPTVLHTLGQPFGSVYCRTVSMVRSWLCNTQYNACRCSWYWLSYSYHLWDSRGLSASQEMGGRPCGRGKRSSHLPDTCMRCTFCGLVFLLKAAPEPGFPPATGAAQPDWARGPDHSVWSAQQQVWTYHWERWADVYPELME